MQCATFDGFEGGSMVVTADGKVYATFAFNVIFDPCMKLIVNAHMLWNTLS